VRRTLFNDEHEALKATTREFLQRHVVPRMDEFVQARALPRDFWIEAGKQGLLGLNVPDEWGGGGGEDFLFSVVVAEQFARVSASISSCVGIHSAVCAPYLVDLTTDAQKRRWLPKLCTGELVCAIAMTEPGGGSDLAALRTTAVRDGDAWVLNGSKTFITNGYGADLVIVAARTDPGGGAKGITLFGVENGMAGFTRGRKLDKVGQTESDTSELFFADVRVPDALRIGPVDGGFIAMMERLVGERVGAAVANTAHAAQILSETIEYVKQRKAFGQAVGSFQHNKFKVAELVTQIDVTQAFVDQCILAHATGELSTADAAKAKWWSAQVQNDVLDECVQLYGGYGYMNEYRVARAWRDARVTKIWAGSNEIMKELIGRDLGL
jgi:alkylation response protein AidB-like acyl-CoA dehydrogenase